MPLPALRAAAGSGKARSKASSSSAAAAAHPAARRQGCMAQVSALPEAAAGFTRAVLVGLSLGQALDGAGPDFAFEPWLLAALQQGWLAGWPRSIVRPLIIRSRRHEPQG